MVRASTQSETDGLHKSTSCVGEEEYVEEEEEGGGGRVV